LIGEEARNVPADIVHEDNSALARVARKTTPGTTLAALGIVYGDLGTSPLYTLQAVVGAIGGHFSREAALGSLSLIFWALIITISVKYCLFVMRADNHGEGGILALMSMTGANWSEGRRILIVMGLFGAALIYGDGIITPAISVLSALEGLNVATDVFKPHIVSMAVATRGRQAMGVIVNRRRRFVPHVAAVRSKGQRGHFHRLQRSASPGGARLVARLASQARSAKIAALPAVAHPR
jgi:hypothetical protein